MSPDPDHRAGPDPGPLLTAIADALFERGAFGAHPAEVLDRLTDLPDPGVWDAEVGPMLDRLQERLEPGPPDGEPAELSRPPTPAEADDQALDGVMATLGDPADALTLPAQRFTVQYGRGGYVVREEATGEAVSAYLGKSACIADAEQRNGWPVTGTADGYAASRDRAATDPEPEDRGDPAWREDGGFGGPLGRDF